MVTEHLKGLVGGKPPQSAKQVAAWFAWNRWTRQMGDRLVTDVAKREDYPGTDEGWERIVAFDDLARRAMARKVKPEPEPDRPVDLGRVPVWAWRSTSDLDDTAVAVMARDFVAQWHSTERPTKGLMLLGQQGTGKTSIAAAIAHDCDPGAYWPMRELARRAREDAVGPGGLIPTLVTRPLLILDDVGVERTDFQRDTFREIIEGRADRGGLLVAATNLTPRELQEHVGERCWSRLHAMVSSVPLTGRDRRLPEPV